jgi:hypothetical protein
MVEAMVTGIVIIFFLPFVIIAVLLGVIRLLFGWALPKKRR